jgi:nucleotide-binding universal stress UspA family protein
VLPIKSILCPTDFSEPSYEALGAACELAEHFGSDLIILHVVAPIPQVASNIGPSAFNINTYQFELEKDAKKQLVEVVLERVPKSLKVRQLVTHGNAADKILQSAKVDLIVIASHGRTGWRDIFFGSVAEKVVRLSPVPVLTVSGRKTP